MSRQRALTCLYKSDRNSGRKPLRTLAPSILFRKFASLFGIEGVGILPVFVVPVKGIDRDHPDGAGLQADAAQLHFDAVIRKKKVPDEMPEHSCGVEPILLSRLLADVQLVASRSEARRLIQQGAVSLDGERVSEDREISGPGDFVLKVGKRRFLKVSLQ